MICILIVKSYEFMVYNYVNFINIFYDKELCFYINTLWLIHYLYYNMF